LRSEQRLENVDIKYVEYLQNNMRAQNRRCTGQYKPPIKQGTLQVPHVHP